MKTENDQKPPRRVTQKDEKGCLWCARQHVAVCSTGIELWCEVRREVTRVFLVCEKWLARGGLKGENNKSS